MAAASGRYLAVCLLLAALATPPAAADTPFQQLLDVIIPDSIQEFLGLSPPPPPEVGQRILSEAEILELEKPQEGFVAAGEADVKRLNLPPNGPDFPNALLTLKVLNEEGDADIFCVPSYLFDIANAPPSHDFSIWKSDHSQGNDHIFISREHSLYEQSKVGRQEDGVTAEAVSIVCSVMGFAAGGTEYVLELDIDHSDRTLIPDEQAAMKDIFDSCCGDPAGCQQWKSRTEDDGTVSMDFCHFTGSMCNGEGKLLRLNMAQFGLQCEFPVDSIAKLEGLEKLEMGKNELTGDVSDILTSLKSKKRLEYVHLADNMIKGSLTSGDSPVCELTHGSGLAFLDLARNDMEGEIPACLFDEKSELRELVLDDNMLEGPLPEMSAASSLQTIRLVNVGLTGTIPEAVGEMKKLVAVNFAENNLEGPIPSTLGSALSLRSVSLGENMLEGTIPASLATAENLRFAWLQGNKLEGFAEEWNVEGALKDSKLIIFDAAKNKLEGDLPVGFLSAPTLSLLQLSGNKLSGEIPSAPGMFPRLTSFMFGGNAFEGSIPADLVDAGFFNEKALLRSPFKPRFDLSNNELTGDIPDFLHARNVPRFLWDRIRLGGNKFGIPCPLPEHLTHIKDLVCEDGTSEIEASAADAEAKENPRDVFKQPFLDFDPSVLGALTPEAEATGPAEAPAPSPDSELVANEELDIEEGFQLQDVNLASRDEDDRDVDLLVSSKMPRGTLFNAQNEDADEDNDVVQTATSMKTAASGIFVVAGAAFMLLILVGIIAVVVVRKRQSEKAAIANDIAAMDLELAAAHEEGDETHMLEGVKTSAVIEPSL